MANYQRILKRLKEEKEELKEERTFIPSKLSPTKKKSVRYEITKKIGKISEKEKETKQKEKKSKQLRKKIIKQLSKKVISRRVLKKSQATVTIKERPRENIFHEENRFFKGEFNQEKKNMFLS